MDANPLSRSRELQEEEAGIRDRDLLCPGREHLSDRLGAWFSRTPLCLLLGDSAAGWVSRHRGFPSPSHLPCGGPGSRPFLAPSLLPSVRPSNPFVTGSSWWGMGRVPAQWGCHLASLGINAAPSPPPYAGSETVNPEPGCRSGPWAGQCPAVLAGQPGAVREGSWFIQAPGWGGPQGAGDLLSSYCRSRA